jgi:hypothetical protein
VSVLTFLRASTSWLLVLLAPLALLLLVPLPMRLSARLRLSVLLMGLLCVLGGLLMLVGSPRGLMTTGLGPLEPLLLAGALGGTAGQPQHGVV